MDGNAGVSSFSPLTSLPATTRTPDFGFSAQDTRAQRSVMRGASGTVRQASGMGFSVVVHARSAAVPAATARRLARRHSDRPRRPIAAGETPALHVEIGIRQRV